MVVATSDIATNLQGLLSEAEPTLLPAIFRPVLMREPAAKAAPDSVGLTPSHGEAAGQRRGKAELLSGSSSNLCVRDAEGPMDRAQTDRVIAAFEINQRLLDAFCHRLRTKLMNSRL